MHPPVPEDEYKPTWQGLLNSLFDRRHLQAFVKCLEVRFDEPPWTLSPQTKLPPYLLGFLSCSCFLYLQLAHLPSASNLRQLSAMLHTHYCLISAPVEGMMHLLDVGVFKNDSFAVVRGRLAILIERFINAASLCDQSYQ